MARGRATHRARIYSKHGSFVGNMAKKEALDLVNSGHADANPGHKTKGLEWIQLKYLLREQRRDHSSITLSDIHNALDAPALSRTIQLSEKKKIDLELAGKDAEDYLERAHNKIRAYPYVGDTKAVRVGPRV